MRIAGVKRRSKNSLKRLQALEPRFAQFGDPPLDEFMVGGGRGEAELAGRLQALHARGEARQALEQRRLLRLLRADQRRGGVAQFRSIAFSSPMRARAIGKASSASMR